MNNLNILKPCKVKDICGGCQLQNFSYAQQLEIKQKKIEKLLGGFCKVDSIIPMENPYHYRNKVQVSFGSYKGRILCGNYALSTHEIVEIKDCQIANEVANAIIDSIKKLAISFKLSTFDENSYKGFLRHVLIRYGYKTKQVMVVIVAGSYVFPKKKDFVNALLKEHPEITTIVMNINNKHTSMILSEKNEVLYGKGYIEDILLGKIFRISPNSFYQVNPIQTERLYSKAIELAQISKKDVLIDAYCGIGTIGILASNKAKEVLSVEINSAAIRDARINAKINDVNNISFICADAGKYMVDLAYKKEKIDVAIMDPARAGADEKFLNSLIKLQPKRIVYISCNPITQKDNLSYLVKKGYTVEHICPVDMFPFTTHCETICLLTSKQNQIKNVSHNTIIV